MSKELEHLEEHYQDVNKEMAKVNTIGGGPSPIPNDKSKEVLGMAYERDELTSVIRELQKVLTASETKVQRVGQASGEIITKTVALKANIASKVCAYNFNRSRLVISGNAIDCCVGTDGNIQVDGFNAARIGYAAGGVFHREIRTVRDIWVVSATDSTIGVMEEILA